MFFGFWNGPRLKLPGVFKIFFYILYFFLFLNNNQYPFTFTLFKAEIFL
jgi:hypothetical protein